MSAGTAPRVLVVAIAVAFVAAACGSNDPESPAAAGGKSRTVEVTLTDNGCEPNALSASAGPTTFHVTNDGSAAVTEFEVLKGPKIVGEVENVAPGLDRSFSLTLKADKYTTKCTGGKKEKGTLEVAAAGTGETTDNAAKARAVKTYLAYVQQESNRLVGATQAFAASVRRGDVAAAQQQYAAARFHYETIEPIAESFGNLDPEIDARAGDVPAAQWTGFHRIEKALWVDQSTAGMAPIADKLVADVTKLRASIPSTQLEPAQIANGAVELLNEVSASKITGEEDRYSHTDLSDFAANVEGSRAAFGAVRPLLAANDTMLATTIDQRFAAVSSALDAYKQAGTVANGYRLYNTLDENDTRALSTKLDALAEPLSKVAAIVL